ncbi:protein-L-isoaspartate(D-aspartate) O-methyltransferase [Vulcaniibacterium tengchongense]|uniref:Protein-L-isoaspartate O-methyltransferase n=1 Tax=Vulcaniibacterium tengchongense TaxID=1273429 RepID=A0A3N4VB69_9GAMM|nr:protein-L-isoaspartate(D-aspartate) O-methyltransferase [Vulcaniibacterium tengchongense]RPE79848.1 protein-L-isoaspartate(D-aspartate) O-methyltransferase [Vulcaniibacterium tengchongense]
MRSAGAIAGVARGVVLGWALGGACAWAQPPAAAGDPYAQPRRALLAELRRQARDGAGEARIDPAALELLARVPRHAYVPAAQRAHAYANRPLAIGYGQTISQPYIVALMTSLAQPKPGQKILEVGTGSGYQAAVLAESGARVYTIEIVAPLAAQARQRLRRYRNVETRMGDGYYGWQEAAPFDAIVVTAAASSIPPPLLAQLKPGGRMVIPVGSSFHAQTLMRVSKDAAGRVRTRQVLPVRFVPLTGGR